LKLKRIPQTFKQAEKVVEKLESAGFSAYFVGGSLRDVLLGRPIHDIDIATSAYPAEVKEIFSRTVNVGIEHGTVMVFYHGNSYEITTFRTESAYQDYRRPEKVTFVRSLEEDLKRRDFTINALAMDNSGEITDLYGGISDLNEGKIRAVGNPSERFSEDALRMMRAFRFAAVLNFTIEEETYQAINEQIHLLKKISVERVRIEFIKMLKSSNRNQGLKFFLQTKAYLYVPHLKFFANGIEKLLNLNKFSLQKSSQVWTLIAYSLDFSQEFLRKFLRSWRESRQVLKQTSLLLKKLTRRTEKFWTNEDLYAAGLENAFLVEELCQLLWSCGNPKKIEIMFAKLPIKAKSEIAVNGNDLLQELQKKPGKWLGDLLTTIEIAIVNGNLKNEYLEIVKFAKDVA